MAKNDRVRSRSVTPGKTRQAGRRQGLPAPLWLALGGLAVLAVGLLLMWRSAGEATPGSVPQVTGKPKLVVDRDQIDFGTVPMDKMVKATFKLTNVGDKPLTINGQPQVQVVEGC